MSDFIINFLVYKSDRKNAKCEFVDLLHFQRTERDVYTEWDDVMKIHSTVENIVTAAQKLQKIRGASFHVSAHLCFTRNTAYKAVNGIYTEHARQSVTISRQYFSSVEGLINWVYYLYMMLNPECTLSLRTVHENPSIRYLINAYYHGPVIHYGPSVKPEKEVEKNV